MLQMSEAQMRECLKDAGCDQKLIDSFESMCGQENRARLSLLISYRLLLLDIIHAEQKKLDCLDYLIFAIKAK